MAPNSPVVALLSIKPIYANAILEGKKKVEFRKRPFRRPVSHVVIYATTPVQRIVGWFQANQFDQMKPSALWRRFATIGGISKDDFNTYYNGSDFGVAIHVHQPRRLTNPISIKRVKVRVAPQSFTYLPVAILDFLRSEKRPLPPKRLSAKRKAKKPKLTPTSPRQRAVAQQKNAGKFMVRD